MDDVRKWERLGERSDKVLERVQRVWALTFRESRSLGPLRSKTYRLGGVTAISISYGNDTAGRPAIPVTGVKAKLDSVGGQVVWGGRGADRFAYDLAIRPSYRRRRRTLHLERNKDILRIAMDLNEVAEKRSRRDYSLAAKPHMPRVMLEFETMPENVPYTSALASAAAYAYSMDTADPALMPLLGEYFVQHVAEVDEESGMVRIPLSFCDTRLLDASVGMYEDYSHMKRTRVANPAKRMHMPGAWNPATDICRELGLSLRDLSWSYDQKVVDQVLAKCRERIHSDRYTDDDIVEAVLHPRQPLLEGKEVIRRMRYHVRRTMPAIADGCTDEDLLEAGRDTRLPLTASLLPKAQVMVRVDDELIFPPGAIGPHVAADFLSPTGVWDAAAQPARRRDEMVATAGR